MGFSLKSFAANPVGYSANWAGNQVLGNSLGNVWDKFKDYIPGIGDARAQDEANRINQAEAQLNRDFQERMSNSAYQRATTDMRKAGINPMLAYMQGGAAVPSGSQATVASSPKTGLAKFGLENATGIGGIWNQVTGLQQQQQMNESNIKLNDATAAQKIVEAQKTQIENSKARKTVPLHDEATNVIKNVMDSFKKSAKDVSNKPLIKNILQNIKEKHFKPTNKKPSFKININKKENLKW